MNGEIGLLVSCEIVTSQGHGSVDGRFENRGGDGFALPEDFSRNSDIDSNEFHASVLPNPRSEFVERLGRARMGKDHGRSDLVKGPLPGAESCPPAQFPVAPALHTPRADRPARRRCGQRLRGARAKA